MAQVRYSFDPETKKKIVNSLWLSLLTAGLAFTASITQGGGWKASVITAGATGGTFLLNTIREYVKGRDDV